MQRTLTHLADREFDVAVIGGGIYGACVAWDASLRGLSVALVEKGDFGHATSANSLKIVHGGLRYLQDANPVLVRTMIQERSTWMRIAPHLVHPLPCIMPTYRDGNLLTRKPFMRTALAMTDLLGYDRNRLPDPEKVLPNGRTVSRAECLRLLPGLDPAEVTGGAIWYDAQIQNTERLLLSVVIAASQAGATVANYVEATGFLGSSNQISGIRARDIFTGETFDIRAKVTINCAGAGAGEILKRVGGRPLLPELHLSKAANVVTRQIIPDIACGLPTAGQVTGETGQPKRRTRQLFVVPWRHFSLIGTLHEPMEENGGTLAGNLLTEKQIQHLLDGVNLAYPGAALTLADVYHVQCGYLPAVPKRKASSGVTLLRESIVHDHARQDKLTGLITVVGVKYTTARVTAQKAVDCAVQQLGRKAEPCRTAHTPLYGGQIDRFDDYLAHALASSQPAHRGIIQHLVQTYGSEYGTLLGYIEQDARWGRPVATSSCTTVAEVLHAIRHEMAMCLSDVLERRTEAGAVGLPEAPAVHLCADLMASECGWDAARRQAEIERLYSSHPPFCSRPAEQPKINAHSPDGAVRVAYQQKRHPMATTPQMPKGITPSTSKERAEQPWQLQMFQRSLKKQLKLNALLDFMGETAGQRCLLVTCGDNTGALNWYLRNHGGRWHWGDVAGAHLAEMSQFLGEPVYQLQPDRLAFADRQFDCIVSIDVMEHLQDDAAFLRELRRILRPNGRLIVTVPNGDPSLLANRLKRSVGMVPEVYGHTRAGYSLAELQASVQRAGLIVTSSGGYSRFFTEMLELALNFGYVFLLSHRRTQSGQGGIAPASSQELKTHGMAYRLYSLLYPLMRQISLLDRFLPERINNAVIVSARLPEVSA
ncbi:MAG: hypothetical protein DCC55_28980 [Chloroflexi bacterium]|nr:MAG: hypothetical protein DCC55_28980 [Chloroflexota bacterium]